MTTLNEEMVPMFDTAQGAGHRVSHDRPCPQCGHAMHTYLACSDHCACVPVLDHVPAQRVLALH